jgi:hypothetical protein
MLTPRYHLNVLQYLNMIVYDSTNDFNCQYISVLIDRQRIRKSKLNQENSKYKGSNLLSNCFDVSFMLVR